MIGIGVTRMDDEYEVRRLRSFNKLFEKRIPKEIQKQFENKFEELKSNHLLGKQIKFYFFRELKKDKFRVYYLLNEKKHKMLIISCGDKKSQKKDIKHVLENRKYYSEFLVKLIYFKEDYCFYMAKVSKDELEFIKKVENEFKKYAIKENGQENKFVKEILEGLEDAKHGRWDVV